MNHSEALATKHENDRALCLNNRAPNNSTKEQPPRRERANHHNSQDDSSQEPKARGPSPSGCAMLPLLKSRSDLPARLWRVLPFPSSIASTLTLQQVPHR